MENEIKNQNLNSEQKPEEDIKSETKEQDILFFNVMPKIQNNGEVVEPKITSVSVSDNSNHKTFLDILKQYKIYFIVGFVLIVGGPLIYFFIDNITNNQYKSEDLLVLKPVKNNTSVTEQNFTTPKEWRDNFFPQCTLDTLCGDSSDPDRDGLSNVQEHEKQTDPNNPDSDQDGLADGDEVNVFISNPLEAKTAKNEKFSDLDYVKGGFNFSNDKKQEEPEIKAIKSKMDSFGLHQPTISSVGLILNSIYGFSSSDSASTTPLLNPIASSTPASSSTLISEIDNSLAAKQDRDTKRSNTIKNIEIALVKYQLDNGSYPDSNNFTEMFAKIKPYLKVATNQNDPINQGQFVYGYTIAPDKKDFSLTFYSEVASGPISKNAADAQKSANLQSAETYDNQRKMDLEDLRTALLLYSQANIAGSQDYSFPTQDKYKTLLVPDYITAIPKDPLTGKDYEYTPSKEFDSFTLKTTLQNPPPGNTGYSCNQEDLCDYY
jgi:hypothetical protein